MAGEVLISAARWQRGLLASFQGDSSVSWRILEDEDCKSSVAPTGGKHPWIEVLCTARRMDVWLSTGWRMGSAGLLMGWGFFSAELE
jgi:hypothetical protein